MAAKWTSRGHSEETNGVREGLHGQIEHALGHLYDPVELAKSPLAIWLQVSGNGRPALKLRERLVQAIETLKPSADVPVDSNAWRYYQLLSQRYVSRFAQTDIAMNLNISARQLRRLNPLALQALANVLIAEYGIQAEAGIPQATSTDREHVPEIARKEELAHLSRGQPVESLDLRELAITTLSILERVAQEAPLTIESALPTGLPQVAAQRTATLHALLNLMSVAIRWAGNGRVRLGVESTGDRIVAVIQATGERTRATMGLNDQDRENIKVAEELSALSGGVVETTLRPGQRIDLSLTLSLPSAEGISILVIDDNTDSLQLCQRYLAGTRYRYSGTSLPGTAIELADDIRPQIIVLDLMLPGKDGWELLGQCRAHPVLRDTPIIVCTVLPQKDLAMALGAAGFVQKPFSRTSFLQALDALSVSPAPSTPRHTR